MKIIGNGGHASVVRGFLPFINDDRYFFVAIGDNRARLKEALNAINNGLIPCDAVIHQQAIVHHTARIGRGSVIMAGTIISADVVIGDFCIVNHNATVDHGSILGDFVHIAPGAAICGDVSIGEGALVGVGVGIAPGAVIPEWSIVKAARLDIEKL